jgi:hypothetical protein
MILYGDFQGPHTDPHDGITALYYANPEWKENCRSPLRSCPADTLHTSHVDLLTYNCGFAKDGGCSSGVERRIVDPEVAGSKPVTHPILKRVKCQ